MAYNSGQVLSFRRIGMECTVRACLVHLGSTVVFATLGGFLLQRIFLRRHWGLSHFSTDFAIAIFEVTLYTVCACLGLF
jgi:hypothetical protein